MRGLGRPVLFDDLDSEISGIRIITCAMRLPLFASLTERYTNRCDFLHS